MPGSAIRPLWVGSTRRRPAAFGSRNFTGPLSGDEFEEGAVASRPTGDGRAVCGSTAGFRVEQSYAASAHR
jgi:hypothetical protein